MTHQVAPVSNKHDLRLARAISAATPVVELLEKRQLFAISTIQTLPFFLDFSSDRGELVDKDGQGTGFTRVQANKNGNEYQAALIDLDTAAGLLKITSTGTSTAASNTKNDNTLVNALETQFNATTSGFKITVRLSGPLDYINNPSEQAGVMFGPDQDNFVKLVAISQPTGQFIQFGDETFNGSTYTHQISHNTSVGSFANITQLDLQIVGDAATGTISGYYAINGGAWVKISKTITYTGATKNAFFNPAGRAGIIAVAKNDLPPETFTFDSFRIDAGQPINAKPSVIAARPSNGTVGVSRDAFISVDVRLPSPGATLDPATLNSSTVKLYRSSDKSAVATVLNLSGSRDTIIATPTALLDANTTYTLEITAGLKDTAGQSIVTYSMSFTTGNLGGVNNPAVAFEKVALPTAAGHTYTSMAIGPDGRLYASTDQGLIQRFTINADGTLGAAQDILSLINAQGPRWITGFAFDPQSNPNNMLLWVAHSDVAQDNAADYSGKITKIYGGSLQVVQDAVINLPRSIRGSSTNQVAFGPDGKLYFAQASMTGMGAQDNATGLRSESLLSGAILRLDTSAVGIGDSAIDAKTENGGTYNPFAPGAPLTIYATGIKNAYDLVWTSDGRLYAPSSGATAGGNTPGTPASPYSYGPNQRIDFSTKGAYTGPDVPGLNNVLDTQFDYLFDIKAGGYYGQPNALRGEFVLNGGNPSSGMDPFEVTAYPVGTFPDRNYRGAAYTFDSKSNMPAGIIEYKGNAFNGALNGKLLLVRHGGGDDIVILNRNADGTISSADVGVTGLTGFINPLDILQHSTTGHLYVAEQGKITLVRAIATGANVSTDKPEMYFNDHTATGASPAQKITITNTGTSALIIPADGLTITGTDAARFAITAKPTLPATIAPGQSVIVTITFTASAVGIRTANLQIKSNDADTPIINIALRGLGTNGQGGANEPSLQRVFDLFQLPINVGDSNPLDVYLDHPPVSPNDEILASIFRKAGAGPVTIEPLAVFGVGHATTPTVRMGYYTPGNKQDKTELLTLTGTGSATQTVNPQMAGVTSFDPGSAAFALYATFPSMYPSIYNVPGGTEAYSEERLNTYDSNSPRKVRFYQLKTADGTVVPNAYIFAFEDFNAGYDNQDLVGIIRNVQIAPAGPEIGFENLDNLSFTDRLVFNRIEIQPPDPKLDPETNQYFQPPNNVVHDVAVLRVRNSGSQALNITSLTISASFAIDNMPNLPLSIPAGGSIDLKVRFTYSSTSTTVKTRHVTGTLTIGSNDADEPTSTIQLSGFWQRKNENPEPTLQEIFTLFGYATKVEHSGQKLNNNGKIERIGDEVLSVLWNRADVGAPVTVRQLAAYHGQGNVAFIRYYTLSATGTKTQTNLFTHDGLEGQSILPHLQGSLTSPAYATFNPTKEFGFRVDNVWSNPADNPPPADNPTDQGHYIRWFVARDRNGNIIPNTYLMTMDYIGINYDYNDNVYLVTNVKPVSPPSAPTVPTVTTSGAGTLLKWNANTEANLGGYNVYRSDAADGSFVKINSVLLTASEFLDVTAPVGVMAHYRIVAVDLNGTESSPATISAMRPTDTTPPATPSNIAATGSQSGIFLQWSNNTDPDLAGYNVYRSDSFSGAYTLLNTSGLLTSAQFVDTTAPFGVISYYRITAVDSSNNESAANVANAVRPAGDTTPPAAPSGVVATPSIVNIALDWANNSESDLAGYNIYRSSSQFGTYVKLNASLLTSSDYIDNTATAGATSWYRITAVDSSGNESVAATVNAIRTPDTTAPAVPTGLSATGSTAGIAIDWADVSDPDLRGYNVYVSDSINGTFTKLNTTVLTASELLHTTAAQGTATYYRVTSVDTSGNESAYAEISAIRPDSIPPAAPKSPSASGSFSGVAIDWADNAESDLLGYNIYRSTAIDGIFSKVNASVLTSSDYVDTSAAPGSTTYYRITAVDQFGNESIDAATVSSFRPNLGLNGNMNDLVFDKNGVLHFAYYDTAAKNMKYATRSADGVWSNVTAVDTTGNDVGGWLSIAVDSQNRVGIAYFDGSAGDLRYATLVNGNWDVQIVDSKNSVGLFPSLKFDKNDRPAIAYYKKTTGDLRFATHDGSNWLLAHIDGDVEDVGRAASLAMQPNGLWAIAYENGSSRSLSYAYQTSSTKWEKLTVDKSDSGIAYVSLAFDFGGRAGISYQETGAGDLKYAVLKNGKWVTTTVAWKGAVGMYTRLVYTSDNMANIFYYSKQLNTLMHANGYLGNWQITQLKDNGGRFIAATLGASNKIAYTWLDSVSQALTMDEL